MTIIQVTPTAQLYYQIPFSNFVKIEKRYQKPCQNQGLSLIRGKYFDNLLITTIARSRSFCRCSNNCDNSDIQSRDIKFRRRGMLTSHLKSLVCCVSPGTKKDGYSDGGVYVGEDEISFDDFQILRAIGKGTFGKVCIVQKRDTKKMYAMKYMSKQRCFKNSYLANVIKEIEILKKLEHPFLVNLWYAFQDEEDIFMVVDLLTGGDLRYHIHNNVVFDEPLVKLYLCELSLALDYLQKSRIIHRDVKPDNIILDELGHVHLGDFNIATQVKDFCDIRSLSGTKPYMAPEIFSCALFKTTSYGFAVDWWSLGICAYEMLYKKRPYEITSDMTVQQVYETLNTTEVIYFSYTKIGMINLVKKLLALSPNERIKNLKTFKEQPYVNHMNFQAIFDKKIKPSFVPSQEQLNCDPTFELEEMIIESNPLHKKKKRLAKQHSRIQKELVDKRLSRISNESKHDSFLQDEVDRVLDSFKPFNREKHLREKARQEVRLLPDKLTSQFNNDHGKQYTTNANNNELDDR